MGGGGEGAFATQFFQTIRQFDHEVSVHTFQICTAIEAFSTCLDSALSIYRHKVPCVNLYVANDITFISH